MFSLQAPLKLALGTTKPVPVLKPALGAAAYRGPARFYTNSTTHNRPAQSIKAQSVSAHAPIGVSGAVDAESDPSIPTRPKLWDEFSLADRVAFVTGANRGLGLEMALALAEAGARAVYCIDLLKDPGDDFRAAQNFVERMGTGGRLEYISSDVTDQKKMWDLAEKIGDREGRMDICVAAAGILPPDIDCLKYPADSFRKVLNINTDGVLFTAQAAGRQMERFDNRGSIILIGSMSGSITNEGHSWVPYNTSKSAVLQMARSMACELGKRNIRVNTLSPGYIYTKLTAAFLEPQPELLDTWSSQNPMARLGRPDELRGVIVWLASDASSFCTGSDIIVDGGHRAW